MTITLLKFRFSEKATNSKRQDKWETLSNFVGFSEYLNFFARCS